MKFKKVLLTVQVLLMYLAQLPFLFVLIIVRTPLGNNFNLCLVLMLIGVILHFVIFPISVVNLVFGFLGIFRGVNSPLEDVKKTKLILIPWFIINVFSYALVTAPFCNPFLMLVVPILLCLIVGMTYVFMLSTSMYDFAYIINLITRKKVRKSKALTFWLICLFIFCLDVLSAIVLNNILDKYRIEEQVE